jgi:hypothetical protein
MHACLGFYAFSETALGKSGSPPESDDPFTPQLERAPFPTTCCRLRDPKRLLRVLAGARGSGT